MTITFLPYADFVETAKCLDDKRLGSSRNEAWYILKALRYHNSNHSKDGTASTHEKTLNEKYAKQVRAGYCQMWWGYEDALAQYLNVVLLEWQARGFQNLVLRPYSVDHGLDVAQYNGNNTNNNHQEESSLSHHSPILMPPWMGQEYLHSYHRHALMAKLPAHYQQFAWDEDGSLYRHCQQSYPWPVRRILPMDHNNHNQNDDTDNFKEKEEKEEDEEEWIWRWPAYTKIQSTPIVIIPRSTTASTTTTAASVASTSVAATSSDAAIMYTPPLLQQTTPRRRKTRAAIVTPLVQNPVLFHSPSNNSNKSMDNDDDNDDQPPVSHRRVRRRLCTTPSSLSPKKASTLAKTTISKVKSPSSSSLSLSSSPITTTTTTTTTRSRRGRTLRNGKRMLLRLE